MDQQEGQWAIYFISEQAPEIILEAMLKITWIRFIRTSPVVCLVSTNRPTQLVHHRGVFSCKKRSKHTHTHTRFVRVAWNFATPSNVTQKWQYFQKYQKKQHVKQAVTLLRPTSRNRCSQPSITSSIRKYPNFKLSACNLYPWNHFQSVLKTWSLVPSTIHCWCHKVGH